MHSDAVESTTRLPAELFKPSGRTMMIALAAFVRFAGREITLYGVDNSHLALKLRQLGPGVPCTVTEEALRCADFVGGPGGREEAVAVSPVY